MSQTKVVAPAALDDSLQIQLDPLAQSQATAAIDALDAMQAMAIRSASMDTFATPQRLSKSSKSVSFSDLPSFFDVDSCEEYDRHSIDYVGKSLTPELVRSIKSDLNELKSEMEVHEASRCFTRFYPV